MNQMGERSLQLSSSTVLDDKVGGSTSPTALGARVTRLLNYHFQDCLFLIQD